MSLSANKSRLMALTRELSIQWEDTQHHWRDARSQEFGQKYMERLLLDVEKAVTVCDKLDKLITHVRSDCE
jgi:hypothetical protein